MWCKKKIHPGSFTHRRFHTQTLLRTDAFTHRSFYTKFLVHTYAFTHKRFYTQMPLHTGSFTPRHFYTQTFCHTDAFTHRHSYTQTHLPRDPFTQRPFYTQMLFHTDALRTDTSTHRGFDTLRLDTQTRLHRDAFTHGGLRRTLEHSQFYIILPQFLTIEPHFLRKGCDRHLKIAILPEFWRSNLISCEKVAADTKKFLTIEPYRTSFRAKGLHFVPPRWHCAPL